MPPTGNQRGGLSECALVPSPRALGTVLSLSSEGAFGLPQCMADSAPTTASRKSHGCRGAGQPRGERGPSSDPCAAGRALPEGAADAGRFILGHFLSLGKGSVWGQS